MLNGTLADNISGRPGKRCAMCGQWKEHWQFNRAGDGLQSYCRECQKKYRKKHPSKEYKNDKDDKSLDIWQR